MKLRARQAVRLSPRDPTWQRDENDTMDLGKCIRPTKINMEPENDPLE